MANSMAYTAHPHADAGFNTAGVNDWLELPKVQSLEQGYFSSLWQSRTPDQVKALLVEVVKVLQPKFASVSGFVQAGQAIFATTWRMFGGKFMWLRSNNTPLEDICMPYKKSKLSRKRKAQDQHAHNMSINKGYLVLYLGKANGKKVDEYAHRLVCYAFNGKPPQGCTHVNHLCNNPVCLNPQHLVWTNNEGNLKYKGGSKPGLVPGVHEDDEVDDDDEYEEYEGDDVTKGGMWKWFVQWGPAAIQAKAQGYI